MLSIERIDTSDRRQVQRYVALPFRLYADSKYWVPPIRADVQMMLDRNKHPFFEHSSADFFLAVQNGQDVGRIAALENVNYNRQHGSRMAQFYHFDCEEDPAIAAALFDAACSWARDRNLDSMVGPKGMSAFDGYGLLQDGYDQPAMMNMMNYNFPYYLPLVEAQGFVKEVDFVSHYMPAKALDLDPRIHHIADRVRRRGNLRTIRFRNKRELRQWANKIGRAYNHAFVDNWEYVPLTDREIKFVLDNIMLVAVPGLIKVIAHEDDIVGFAFGFPDITAAMQRSKGRLFPFGALDMLLSQRRAVGMSANGIGILPRFQGRGGNALLYAEMSATVQEFGFGFAELTQVAETAVQMRQDMINLGGTAYKNHRVYRKQL